MLFVVCYVLKPFGHATIATSLDLTDEVKDKIYELIDSEMRTAAVEENKIGEGKIKELIVSEEYLCHKAYTHIRVIYETDKFIKFEYVDSGHKEIITQEKFNSRYTIEEVLEKPGKSVSVKELMDNAKEDFNSYMTGYMNGYMDGKQEAEKEYRKILDEIYAEVKNIYEPSSVFHKLLVFIKGKMPPSAYKPTNSFALDSDKQPREFYLHFNANGGLAGVSIETDTVREYKLCPKCLDIVSEIIKVREVVE